MGTRGVEGSCPVSTATGFIDRAMREALPGPANGGLPAER